MLGRYGSLFNNAEYGAPATSARGEQFRASVVSARVVYRAAPVGPGQTLLHKEIFGAFAVRPAFNRMVFAPSGYSGSFPLDQQPLIRRPNPWSDPTRGAP